MGKIQYTLLSPSDNVIIYMEKIRFEAHNDKLTTNPLNSFYGYMLKNGSMLVFTALKDGKPVAGAYVSNLNHAIHIEHVFVKPELQNSDDHIGSNLIKYIISCKAILELYYKEKLDNVRIEYINDRTKHIYQNLGFEEDTISGQLKRGL